MGGGGCVWVWVWVWVGVAGFRGFGGGVLAGEVRIFYGADIMVGCVVGGVLCGVVDSVGTVCVVWVGSFIVDSGHRSVRGRSGCQPLATDYRISPDYISIDRGVH